MSVKGWEGAIKYSNRIVLEAVGTGSGGAGQDYDLDYEADDEVGVITDDETKIEVFLDGVLQATTGIYTLDGDGGAAGVGQINLIGSHDGEVIEASYYTYATIGHVQSVGISQSNNVEPVHQIGSQLPVDLKEGNIDISLSLERCFIGLDLISIVVHEISEARGFLAAHDFDIDVLPKGDSGGNPLLTVRGKFNNHSLAMSQDAILMDSADLIGKTIDVTTV